MKAKRFSKKANQVAVIIMSLLMGGILCANQTAYSPDHQSAVNPNPPDHIVKLIFIHHSCGENLLRDENGAMGLALSSNNYFVSDTNYGWGPDGIGDRTDILDWPEWFLGQNSKTYLQALFNESEQNSWYSWQVADSGGENEIILFKSCFPNSDMGGRPDDAPQSGNSLTVASAKQIYIDLLDTFAQYPDKLFVVLTAPPMREISRPESTRAFNTWLVQDWLDEANYPYDNVAVWDFYNVLTGPNNHHRVVDGAIQYVTDQGGNTLYYPDGEDDHPSQQGNLKAVEEFVPMLNVFYNRWQNSASENNQSAGEPSTEELQTEVENAESQMDEQVPSALNVSGLLDGFDSDEWIWDCFADETANTQIQCEITARMDNTGNAAYHVQFDVAPQSWATAVTFFDDPLLISGTNGLSMEIQIPDGNPVNLIVYQGNDDNRETYLYALEPGTFPDWRELKIHWTDFRRAEWESGNQENLNADHISGFGFGFDGLDSEANSGELWVDNIIWLTAEEPATSTGEELGSSSSESVESVSESESSNNDGGNGLLACPGVAAILFVVLTFTFLHTKTRLM